MKLALHDNSLSLRGTTVAMYDYAYYSRELLNLEPIIIYNKKHSANSLDVYNKFKREFEVFGYEDLSELNKITELNKVDKTLFIKGGKKDGVITNNTQNLINAITVCNESDIHGDIFAMGSKWLSDITGGKIPYVPYMINLPNIEGDLREQLNIPKNALVFGRNGGRETFDLQFVKNIIPKILEKRSDVYFLFQFTDRFINHERVIHLEGSSNMGDKVKFINTCDAMLHARLVGESFGLSCGEFSVRNKPVITYGKSYERNHIDILGDKGIYYNDVNDIYNILLNSNITDFRNKEWNMYKEYEPKKVIEKFKVIYKL